MTPEEAAEEILGGQPYTTCRRCAGSGMSDKPVRPGVIALRNYCESCDGSGLWLRGDYVAACHIVGKEPPSKPQPKSKGHMGLAPWPEFTDELKKQFASKLALPTAFVFPQGEFRKEYMGTWSMAEEERNDTADAMKYALSHHPSNKRP